MDREILDNPIWASLCGNQACFAVGSERVKRYPREIAPFVAIGSAESAEGQELAEWIDEDEEVYIVGAIPSRLEELQVLSDYSVLQMTCGARIELEEGGQEIVSLHDGSAPAMQSLTALVYPRFFRSRTHELGRFFGIWDGARLAAMAGERMSFERYREISGVCTHPDFQRRGYSKMLIARVVNRILTEGNMPFLHVDVGNEKAISLYRSLGFMDANVVPMALVRRGPQ